MLKHLLVFSIALRTPPEMDMYAVIKTGGKQYRVENGAVLEIERVAGEVGSNVKFAEVLLVAKDGKFTVGQPTVAGATVEAQILADTLDDKKLSFKKLKRQGKQWKKGHRQQLSRVKITGISA